MDLPLSSPEQHAEGTNDGRVNGFRATTPVPMLDSTTFVCVAPVVRRCDGRRSHAPLTQNVQAAPVFPDEELGVVTAQPLQPRYEPEPALSPPLPQILQQPELLFYRNVPLAHWPSGSSATCFLPIRRGGQGYAPILECHDDSHVTLATPIDGYNFADTSYLIFHEDEASEGAICYFHDLRFRQSSPTMPLLEEEEGKEDEDSSDDEAEFLPPKLRMRSTKLLHSTFSFMSSQK